MSFLDRLLNKKTPPPATVQEPRASEASEALANTAQSHTKKKGGGCHLSSLFYLKSKSKTKKPTAGDSTDAADVKANTSRKRSAPSGDAPKAATDGQDATPGDALGALAAGKDGDVAGQDADAAGTTPVEDLDPWSRAYAELKRDDSTKGLVETCEKILTHRANPGNPADAEIPLDTPNQFHSLTEAESVKKLPDILRHVLAKYRKETWWGEAVEGADMVISKIGKGVGDALQACQPAAFAWSAICLVVPAVVQPLKEDRKVVDGLEYVVERMDWFISLTKVVTRKDWPDGDPFRDHRASTEIEVVKLFKAMLKYEMECACRAYDTKAVVRLAGDLFQTGDWDTKLERIKTLDNRISKDIQQYQLGELTLYSSQIADNTEDLLFEI